MKATCIKKLCALFLTLALMLSACLLPTAFALDWRDQLRDAFGLDDGGSYEDAAEADDTESESSGYVFDDPITDPQQIVNYLSLYGELPDNFITKKEAEALGWDKSNYVGDVAPGKSIGGDRFGNYEGSLPSARGRTWYECDANYSGRKRGAERVLFSSDGLYFYTNDHYNTFTEMHPEALQ